VDLDSIRARLPAVLRMVWVEDRRRVHFVLQVEPLRVRDRGLGHKLQVRPLDRVLARL